MCVLLVCVISLASILTFQQAKLEFSPGLGHDLASATTNSLPALAECKKSMIYCLTLLMKFRCHSLMRVMSTPDSKTLTGYVQQG